MLCGDEVEPLLETEKVDVAVGSRSCLVVTRYYHIPHLAYLCDTQNLIIVRVFYPITLLGNTTAVCRVLTKFDSGNCFGDHD